MLHTGGPCPGSVAAASVARGPNTQVDGAGCTPERIRGTGVAHPCLLTEADEERRDRSILGLTRARPKIQAIVEYIGKCSGADSRRILWPVVNWNVRPTSLHSQLVRSSVRLLVGGPSDLAGRGEACRRLDCEWHLGVDARDA